MNSAAKKRVLVVDDDPGQARLISILLRNEFDATVDTAYSCEEAREDFVSDGYDLITLDYQLPDGDGLNLLAEIQKRTNPPPVVIITGHGDEQTAVSAFKAGAFGYVVKDKRMSTMIVEEARSAMARAGLERVEAALADSQNRFQEMFEASTLGIMTFDKDGVMENVNSACVDLLGIAEIADTGGFSLFARGYLSEDEILKVRRGESISKTVKFDFDLINREGLYKSTRTGAAYLEGTLTPLMRGGSEGPRGYLAQIADVTDRELKNNAIKAQRDLAVAVMSATSLEEALSLVLSAILDSTAFHGGGIYVLDKDTGVLRLAAHQGLSEGFVKAVGCYAPDSPNVRLVMEKKPAFLSYADRPESDIVLKEGLRSVSVVPLVYRDEAIGCLNVSSRTRDDVDDETRDIIVALAAEAAQAIQREMTAETLNAERVRMACIMDALPVGFIQLNRDGLAIRTNSAARELAKLTPEQEAMRTDGSVEWETTDWEGNPVPAEEMPFGTVLATGKAVVGVRISVVDGKGRRIYVSESAAPVFDENGEIESVVLVLEEMTALREALNTLRWAERLYRETVESLNEGLWVLDADFVTTFASDRMAQMLGYEPEEMTGRSVFDFVSIEDEALLRRNLEIRRQGIAQKYDCDWLHKDGHRVNTYLAAAPIMDEQGNFVGTHAGVLDISTRKRTERILEETFSMLKTQFETSPDSITVTDLKGSITRASKRTAEMHGFDDWEELVGRNALDLISPEDRERAMDNLYRTLEEGSTHGVEYQMLRKDTSRFTGALNAAVVRDAAGLPTGFIATTRDVTASKKAEADLRELNAELERFAHVVSHDLKGPISALIASTHMLKGTIGEVPDPETHKQLEEIAELMEGSATRAFNLVNDLLLLAESGQAPRRLERVSLDEVMDIVIEEKQNEIEERGVTVERDRDLGTILADRTHIYQLLSNLVGNGLKHNDASEPVLRIVRMEGIGDRIRIRVCDNGSGIEEELLPNLFEPFSRSEHGGAGLGLSIVRKVVEIYDGSVEAHNDCGACFDVTLRDYPAG